jgi:hypothetical protein
MLYITSLVLNFQHRRRRRHHPDVLDMYSEGSGFESGSGHCLNWDRFVVFLSPSKKITG